MLTDSNPPTDAFKQDTHEPEIDTTTPSKDWDTLHHDLTPTPEAADLLDLDKNSF
ncbi:MAG: hypothetical protein ACFFAL_04680 [Promethearchaeota archaeon]